MESNLIFAYPRAEERLRREHRDEQLWNIRIRSPYPRKLLRRDKNKGKDSMYTGRDKYRNPSPPARTRVLLHHLADGVHWNATHGPGGINIRDNIVPRGTRAPQWNEEREPEPAEPNEERSLSPAETGTRQHAAMAKVATEPEPTSEGRGESEGENKSLYLADPNCTWLNDLEENPIFVGLTGSLQEALQGTYKRPSTASDPQCLHPWLAKRGLLRRKLTCLVNENKLTLDAMISIALTLPPMTTQVENLSATAIPRIKKRRTVMSRQQQQAEEPPDDQKGGGSDMVAMTFQRGGQEAEEAADVEAEQAGASSALTRSPQPDPAPPKRTPLSEPRRSGQESALRILNATVPAVPQYVKWSEKACTFDRSDHPAVIPKECYALVVSPRIDGYDFSKCLMDGGATNIMYLETRED
ncbi:hypothetical protein QYE76_061789 [Lolium multiflorum]|uniref:Uncharacterized protein n=1 Tax=Lolium multiflorum TaxID=4521 RepID=A0AAD8W7J1_LOLMU|nr:hypothetical protein QYE76_061789 [Lolium multiflorum]